MLSLASVSRLPVVESAKRYSNCLRQRHKNDRTPGVVLMPGQLLPLWLLRRSELQTAEAALAAPKPLDRLLVVVSTHPELSFYQCCIYYNQAAPSAADARRSLRTRRRHAQQTPALYMCSSFVRDH